MGYWKGSGMALALDLAAAMLANGNTGTDMDELGKGSCGSCCQIFIAFEPYLFGTKEEIQEKMDKRIDAALASHPEREGGQCLIRENGPCPHAKRAWNRGNGGRADMAAGQCHCGRQPGRADSSNT